MTDSTRGVARRLAASLASLVVAFVAHQICGDDDSNAPRLLFGLAFLSAPVVAAGLVWTERLSLQLLARGCWWSLMLFGGLVAVCAFGADDRRSGTYLAVACALALVFAGGTGMAARPGRFAPVAFRGILLVALVLAIADTGAFTYFGTGMALFEHRYIDLAVVPLMVVGVIGLLRLRTWGLLVGAVTNVLVVVLASSGVLDLPSPLRWLFVSTAMLQLIVPIPMVVAIVRGRQPAPGAWRRTRLALPLFVIVALVGISAYSAFVHHGPLIRV